MTVRRTPRYAATLLVFCVAGLLSCGEPPRFSDFRVGPAPESLTGAAWTVLATDAEGDGARAGDGDGRSLAFYHDVSGDTLWFKWELWDGFSETRPAVSVALDTNADQATGRSWYGANEAFTFDLLASVGPVEESENGVRGYNGITDADGVGRTDWMNVQSGGLVLHVDEASRSYFLGIRRSDLTPDLERFNVVGSVGHKARWNDDIGEVGFATIELDVPDDLEAEDSGRS